MQEFSYDPSAYGFSEMVKDWFQCDDLTVLMEEIDLLTREKDQSTEAHKLFYAKAAGDLFQDTYKRFITCEVMPIYGEDIVYQYIPAFRISYPGNIAVGEFHKDSDYRNAAWSEEVDEDNFFLPLTRSFETNAIWVESSPGSGEYSPMESDYGELTMWKGSKLMHGNKINETGKTRVSLDFRVMPMSRYRADDFYSINSNMKFAIGGYYRRTFEYGNE